MNRREFLRSSGVILAASAPISMAFGMAVPEEAEQWLISHVQNPHDWSHIVGLAPFAKHIQADWFCLYASKEDPSAAWWQIRWRSMEIGKPIAEWTTSQGEGRTIHFAHNRLLGLNDKGEFYALWNNGPDEGEYVFEMAWPILAEGVAGVTGFGAGSPFYDNNPRYEFV